MSNLKHGPWKLSDLKDIPKNNKKVFSCFHCGGGSSMGYKLAGFEVIGGVEIDPKMMNLYRVNHNPKHSYLMGVQEFKTIPDKDLPEELFDIDILDGSPPCSSFSMSGDREDMWGVEKKFREGQATQILDDLFFDFIDIANKLRPKIVIAENVKALVFGHAKFYVKQIFKRFSEAGYSCRLFVLNSSVMGVPQARERTFFIAHRQDLDFKPIKLSFNEELIYPIKAFEGASQQGAKPLEACFKQARKWCYLKGEYRVEEWRKKTQGKNGYFNHLLVLPNRVANTQVASNRHIFWGEDRRLSDNECIRLQTFPEDYNFLDEDAGYVCGMSVPPYMMQRLALQIYEQWLS